MAVAGADVVIRSGSRGKVSDGGGTGRDVVPPAATVGTANSEVGGGV